MTTLSTRQNEARLQLKQNEHETIHDPDQSFTTGRKRHFDADVFRLQLGFVFLFAARIG